MEPNNKRLSLVDQLADILVTASNSRTERELCDDIYKGDEHDVIHTANRPYHLSDLSPEEIETFIEPDKKKVKPTKQKPNLKKDIYRPLGSHEEELGEQEGTESGESDDGGGVGTASMGVWDSGITRGAANQVANTKWQDSYSITRGKGNPVW